MILAISDFVTVFEISTNSNGVFAGEVFRLLIGVAPLIGGVTALILNWKNNSVKSWVGPMFVTCWALFWLYLHNFPFVFGDINSLVGAYRQVHYQVFDALVQVQHDPPATGHSEGDIVSVTEKQSA